MRVSMQQAQGVLDEEQVHRHVLAAALSWLADMEVLQGQAKRTGILVQVGGWVCRGCDHGMCLMVVRFASINAMC